MYTSYPVRYSLFFFVRFVFKLCAQGVLPPAELSAIRMYFQDFDTFALSLLQVTQ